MRRLNPKWPFPVRIRIVLASSGVGCLPTERNVLVSAYPSPVSVFGSPTCCIVLSLYTTLSLQREYHFGVSYYLSLVLKGLVPKQCFIVDA